MEYFNNVSSLVELRKQYKELLKKYHPDNPQGSTKAAQEINAEYDKIFEKLKHNFESQNQKSSSSTNNSYNSMKYDFSEDAELREALEKIINFVELNIEIIGCWIWVDGNTKLYKKELNIFGYKWASEKKKWYFHTKSFRKKSNKKLSMEEIRRYYGMTKVNKRKKRFIPEVD